MNFCRFWLVAGCVHSLECVPAKHWENAMRETLGLTGLPQSRRRRQEALRTSLRSDNQRLVVWPQNCPALPNLHFMLRS